MTRSLRAKFILDLTGNVRNQARRFGGSFERMGRLGQRSFERVGRAADRTNRAMNRMAVRGAKVGALAAAAGGAVALRRLGTLEERLERLGIEAGKTSVEMNTLRDAVNDTANDSKIRIDPGELLGALEQIQEKTGDLNFGMAVKREMAIAIQAAGQAGPVIGELVASMYNNLGIRSPEEIREALDILTLQGRRGQFTIPNLAALGPRIFASFGAFDRGGTKGIAEVGALTQMVRQGTGSAEQATTALEAILRTFLDAEKIKQINTVGRAHGFKATDADGRVRSPLDLLKDLIRSAQGDPVKLSKLFDSEAMRGVLPIAQEFRQTGGFGRLDNLAGIQVSGGELASNAERLAGTLSSTARSVLTNVNDFVEDSLFEPLTNLTKSVNALVDSKADLTADDALNLALGTAGAAVGAKATASVLSRGARRRRARAADDDDAEKKRSRSSKQTGPRGQADVDAGRGSRPRSVDPRSRTGAINRLKNVGKTVGKWAVRGARVLSVPGAAFTAADLVSGMLPPASDPSARAVLGGVGGLNATELLRRIEGLQGTAEDGVEETAVMRAQLVAELRQVRVALRNLQLPGRQAIGPAPETGRILTGPQ